MAKLMDDIVQSIPGAGAVKKLFGGPDTPNPELRGEQLTEGASNILGAQLERGGESVEDVAARHSQGIDEVKNQSYKPSGLATASDPDIDRAIQARADRQLESSKIALKNKIKYGASEAALRRGQQAQQAANTVFGVQKMNYDNAMRMAADRKAARNAVLQSILGAAGAIGGAAIGASRGGASPAPAAAPSIQMGAPIQTTGGTNFGGGMA